MKELLPRSHSPGKPVRDTQNVIGSLELYTVVLVLREGLPEFTHIAHVTADALRGARELARRDACKVFDGYIRRDWEAVAIFKGHHAPAT